MNLYPFERLQDELSDLNSLFLSQQGIGMSDRVVCPICHCSFQQGEDCLRCIQNREFQESLRADRVSIKITK